jgi:hypothetical protein
MIESFLWASHSHWKRSFLASDERERQSVRLFRRSLLVHLLWVHVFDGVQVQQQPAVAGGGVGVILQPPSAAFRSVQEELSILKQLPRLAQTADAMHYYRKDSPFKLELARRVALEVFSVPAGEAPVERDFSIAAAVVGKSRRSLAPAQLERLLVFAKKNTRSLNW